MSNAQRRLEARIDIRNRFDAAVAAALRIAQEHGHTKAGDIALHLRVSLDAVCLQVTEKRVADAYIDARGRNVHIDQ